MMGKNILVVDDELHLMRTVAQGLEKEGYSVRTAASAEDALVELRKGVPDLAVLDVRMPGMSGFDLCRKMREAPEWKQVCVIFLTSKGEEINRVLGLELGGDDYMVKPFSAMELAARVKAVLRRRGSEGEEALSSGTLTLLVQHRAATLDGHPLQLPAKEFGLLALLLQKKGRALSRGFLLESVWGPAYEQTSRTVDTHIYRLRKKLGVMGFCLKAVGAVGYKWEDPD